MNTTVIRAILIVVGVLFFLGYTYTLRSDNKSLEASVSSLNAVIQSSVEATKQNKERYDDLYQRYTVAMEAVDEMNTEIKRLYAEQSTKEVEVIKYVNKLPEGFEKQCLLMPVPPTVGRVSN